MATPFTPVDLGDGAALRPVTVEDASALYVLARENAEHLAPWTTFIHRITRPADMVQYVKGGIEQRGRNDGVQCVITLGDALQGMIGYHYVDWPHGCAAFGYWLGAGAEGKGLMTRALAAMVRHGFQRLELHRLELYIGTGNDRSLAVARRLGFVHEGVMRDRQMIAGRRIDLNVYALLRAQWQPAGQGPL